MSYMSALHAEMMEQDDGATQTMEPEPKYPELIGRYICPYCGQDWSGDDVGVVRCCGEVGHCEEYDPMKHDD